VEFFLELWLFPWLKGNLVLVWLGVLGAFTGFVIRLLALFQAKHNFTHDIAETKKTGHILVSDGIYKYIRHPGYMGWFWFSIFTQVILMNPLCIAGFAYAGWKFFSERIKDEEKLLSSEQFFGKSYEDYRKKTPTYIPLIP